MKIIRNNIIPFKGYVAINLFGILFVRKNAKLNDEIIRHESIHSKLIKEMLYIPFYLWYWIEYVIRRFIPGDAYMNMSFEKEAYENQKDENYLSNRKHFAWFKYLKNKK